MNSSNQKLLCPTPKRPLRQAFTLIELLFVIAIISVLSTMALGIMKNAQDDAKEAATRSRALQIESILQVELEDYEVRRLPVALSVLVGYVRANPLYTDGGGNPINVGVQVRNLKRRILQDIINAEMPRPLIRASGGVPVRDAEGNLQFDYNDDLGVFPTTKIPGTDPTAIGFTAWLNNNYPSLRPFLNSLTPSRVRSWQRFNAKLIASGPVVRANFNLPGEYLYETLARISIDGAPAIELLGPRAIGDSDNDGFFEVVDAWGAPMQLRIWQVDANEVNSSDVPLTPQNPNPTTDIWRDVVGFDFDLRDPDGVPQGYSVIDSTVPREVGKLRFEVVSTRLVY